jgi:hypothetical protein
MLTGGIPATMPEVFITICPIAGIGIKHAERVAIGNTSSTITSAMDTSLDRRVMMFCNESYSAGGDVFCD